MKKEIYDHGPRHATKKSDYTMFVSSIKADSLTLDDNTMIQDLAASLIEENEDWKYGDILEFICCRQLKGHNSVRTDILSVKHFSK